MKEKENNFVVITIILSIIISLIILSPVITLYLAPNLINIILSIIVLIPIIPIVNNVVVTISVSLFLLLLFLQDKINKIYNILNKIFSLLSIILLTICFIINKQKDSFPLAFINLTQLLEVSIINTFLISIYDNLLKKKFSPKQDINEQQSMEKEEDIETNSTVLKDDLKDETAKMIKEEQEYKIKK